MDPDDNEGVIDTPTAFARAVQSRRTPADLDTPVAALCYGNFTNTRDEQLACTEILLDIPDLPAKHLALIASTIPFDGDNSNLRTRVIDKLLGHPSKTPDVLVRMFQSQSDGFLSHATKPPIPGDSLLTVARAVARTAVLTRDGVDFVEFLQAHASDPVQELVAGLLREQDDLWWTYDLACALQDEDPVPHGRL